MKRFTFVTTLFSVSILAVWMVFQLLSASQSTAKKENTSLRLQPSHNEIMKAVDSGKEAVVPVTGVEARTVAPIYDASGALVSDPTGTIQATNNPKIAPVFDANGEVISDPTGTLVNASNP